MQLGLRHASAFTQQAIAVAAMLHHRGNVACASLRSDERTQMVHAVGQAVRRKAPKLRDPSLWLDVLPTHPSQLR